MYKQCNTEWASEMQQKYGQCLMELMSVMPYSEITVQSICDKMGTTRKAFYHYFKNKKGCLYYLIDHIHYDFMNYELPEEMDLKGYPRIVLRFLVFQKEMRDFIDILIQNELMGVLLERFAFYIRNNEKYIGSWSEKLEPAQREDALIFYASGMLGLWKPWHDSGYRRSVYEMAESICQLISEEQLKLLE